MTAAAMRAPSPAPGGDVGLPPEYLVLGRAGSENFPVASRFLPPELRSDLMALYGWARLVDELGDDFAGDRLAALDEVERQLRVALALGGGRTAARPGGLPAGEARASEPALGRPGEPAAGNGLHPLVARMAEAVRRLQLPTEPLLDLVEANRQDQTVKRYETFDDLLGYCRLSANPVGRMVLAIFGVATPQRTAWSDDICTALQLVEHWQDVAEDAIVGRAYLPLEDMARFGVSVEELVPPHVSYVDRGKRGAPGGASEASRALVAFESARARKMLDAGTPLIASLPGRLRVAVAGFVAGGHAALDALAALDFDVYADTAQPTPTRFASHLGRLLVGAWGHKWPIGQAAQPRGQGPAENRRATP
jgi:squalene synthase HpnC